MDRTPFVGRGHELLVLRDYLAQSWRGRGQVVAISGEPGLGKSRLVEEFRAALGGTETSWFQAVCSLERRSVPWGARHQHRQQVD